MSWHGLAANVLVGLLLVFSLALTGLAGRAWAYARDTRTLLLSLAFGGFFVKGIVLVWTLFTITTLPVWALLLIIVDLAVLATFYASSLR